MATNIFQDSTKSVPTRDNQVIRVDMEELQIGGRKSELPANAKSGDMSIKHVGNADGR